MKVKVWFLLCLVVGAVVGGERDVSLAGTGWKFAKDPTCELRAEAVDFNDSGWEAVAVIRRDAPGALKLTVSAPGLATATAELP